MCRRSVKIASSAGEGVVGTRRVEKSTALRTKRSREEARGREGEGDGDVRRDKKRSREGEPTATLHFDDAQKEQQIGERSFGRFLDVPRKDVTPQTTEVGAFLFSGRVCGGRLYWTVSTHADRTGAEKDEDSDAPQGVDPLRPKRSSTKRAAFL